MTELTRAVLPEKWAFAAIVIMSFLIFLISPVRRMGDSKYCLLVSQSLLEHRAFDTSGYLLFKPSSASQSPAFKNRISIRRGLPYQFERNRKRQYYYFPPGSSILSSPFVGLSMPLHQSPAENGVYSERNERRLQHILGSALMAGVAGFLYLAARILLNRTHSILLTIAGTLGTMVLSTASRGLPSHSWGIFLLTIVVYFLLRQEADDSNRRWGNISQVAIATILAWTYFVRPTFFISILGISLYLVWAKRRIPVAYIATGMLWLGAFLLYSQNLYDQLLPNYYLPGRVNFSFGLPFWSSLSGVLFSPSRGLLIFVPTLLACGYLLVRYRRFVPYRKLVFLALAIIVLHAVLIASFRIWWGGYSYGPRLFTDILPWFFLLGILSLKARQEAKPKQHSTLWKQRLESGLIFVLLVVSIFIHATGAWSYSGWKWNEQPAELNGDLDRLWDWRNPQFLSVFQDTLVSNIPEE